jgi:large subunit ribosomal protein L16
MVLMPKRVKYRKQQRGRIRGNATRCNTVEFGEWGIQALERGYITARQIEAARVALNRAIGGVGQFWLRIFPHKPVTAKPNETRMGKGKGDVKEWVAVVKPGTIIFELSAVSENLARLAFNRQAHKLPLKVRLVRRKHA